MPPLSCKNSWSGLFFPLDQGNVDASSVLLVRVADNIDHVIAWNCKKLCDSLELRRIFFLIKASSANLTLPE